MVFLTLSNIFDNIRTSTLHTLMGDQYITIYY